MTQVKITLRSRIKAHSGLDSIRYLRRLATKAVTAARTEGQRVVILAGDLNSVVNTTTVMATDTGLSDVSITVVTCHFNVIEDFRKMLG